MGRKENPLLVYYNQPERFAQLMNGLAVRRGRMLEGRRHQGSRPQDRGREDWHRRKAGNGTGICSKKQAALWCVSMSGQN